MERADRVYKRISNLSTQQNQRIADSIRRDPARAAQSRSFQAWLDDERLRQENSSKS